MVISRTKYPITEPQIRDIFAKAGLGPVSTIRTLGAGEFNAVFAVEAGERTYALKVAAPNTAVQIYEQNMMESELAWYDLIQSHTDIRTPKIHYRDLSRTLIPTNYFIMEFLPGCQKDQLTLNENQQLLADQQLARMHAKIHRIPGPGFGYPQSGLKENWYEGLRHILENLREDARRAGYAMPRLDPVMAWLDVFRPILEAVPCRLISFDGWDPNFISIGEDSDHPEFAWIDPERCFWGDPVLDFVPLDIGHIHLDDKTAVLEAYNALAEFPILPDAKTRIRYGFGLSYLAAIMECERYYRYTPENPIWERNSQNADLFYNLAFRIFEENKEAAIGHF